jgi:hypothetical protein
LARYPDEAPVVEIKNATGELGGDSETAESMMEELNTIISETIEENIGMAMIFAIHAAVQVCLRPKGLMRVLGV